VEKGTMYIKIDDDVVRRNDRTKIHRYPPLQQD
jgi:hypothetical protein